MFGGFSIWHWLFILFVAVLLFGNRLPEVARSLGRSVNEFKKGLREVKDNFEDELNSEPAPRERLQPPQQKVRSHETEAADMETESPPAETHKE